MSTALGRETGLLDEFSVPTGTQMVLIIGESGHWDPNWLYTSEEAYERRIRGNLGRVIDTLEKDQRRRFTIESLFFLRRFWEREPNRRGTIRKLVNTGQLRFGGTGLTTPDTVLPSAETIIRDYLIGQEWLREHGMNCEPTLAYLPDDFGHSPALPGVLQSMGFDKAGIDRLDGMSFIGANDAAPKTDSLNDSSAMRLLNEHRTLDFVWRGPDGAEVLCHWNALNYFQGERFSNIGLVRRFGVTFGMPWRTGRRFSSRVDKIVDILKPLARTPYMYCPVNCDWNGPIEGLSEMIDRYNRTHYATTGVWTVCGSMEDYLGLVEAHRADLPTLELDPNPRWMGFYAGRPDIKVCSNRIARKLKLAEKLSVLPQDEEHSIGESFPEIQKQIDESWELLTLSNHHDFITGTSPDRVWDEEQGPWLADAESLADDALVRTGCHFLPARISGAAVDPPAWSISDGILQIHSTFYDMEISEAAGGCITRLDRRGDGEPLISAPANDLISYRDTGGLWRMGHELKGGALKRVQQSSDLSAEIEVGERYGALEVRVASELQGLPYERWLWIRDDSPIIKMRVVGTAAARTTVSCLFPTMIDTDTISMDVPGAVVERPRVKLYDPTFWAARNFAQVKSSDSIGGCCVFLGGPSGVSFGDDGKLEWVILRNAPREKSVKLWPSFSARARQTDPDEHVVDYAVWFHRPEESPGKRPPFLMRQVLGESWLSRLQSPLDAMADSVISTNVDGVSVQTIKRADNGAGWIVRLEANEHLGESVVLDCHTLKVNHATLCNGREQDLRELPMSDGQVEVPIENSILSVRLTA